jgi:hypothetical protein
MTRPSDLAVEVRLLRIQLGELARILAPLGYPQDPAVPDEEDHRG